MFQYKIVYVSESFTLSDIHVSYDDNHLICQTKLRIISYSLFVNTLKNL